ncbi:MAG: tRNA (adenosine(37)-N6)-threonylcarbamoyltransferase complex ATPase subunit type 1 TsaE [Dehalococcoidia bacterium]|nr:tRNA (adenosine(37)-N6)-threonylcarbamoyltransferase complex ATPase subunit type 1 TsaE [Dehalococcoidia bacterium]
MSDEAVLTITSADEEATRDAGARLGRLLRRGDVVLLSGELGSGKTCFTQGIARGLDIEQPVTSPSFVLMNEYDGRETLFHADLYRMEEVEELDDLGLWDYAERGVLVLEWPERGAQLLPGEGVQVELQYGDTERDRVLQVTAIGVRGQEIARELGTT